LPFVRLPFHISHKLLGFYFLPMNNERLRYLLEAYLNQRIQIDEFHELVEYIQVHHQDQSLAVAIDEMAQTFLLVENAEVPTDEIYNNIRNDRRFIRPIRTKRIYIGSFVKKLWPVSAAAAIVLLLVFFYISPHHQLMDKSEVLTEAKVEEHKEDISPGRKKALITFADGTKIPLNNLTDQNFETANGIEVQLADGKLTYKMPNLRESTISTISTPIGGEYQLTLSDGTRVWLNANSSISYPIGFNEGTREVKMTGEVYFEVAGNKQQPFVVKIGDASIKVLGTHFNVNAYPDESSIKTTLISGSVQVEKRNKKCILKPGQQAEIRLNSNNNIQVSNVDVEEMLAWKNGYFLFNEENLESVMKKISRWYDVDVSYKGNVANKKLDGTISRMENIQQLLKALEITGTAHFKLEGRRIMVQK